MHVNQTREGNNLYQFQVSQRFFLNLQARVKVNTKLCVCASHTPVTVGVLTKVLNGKTGCFLEDVSLFVLVDFPQHVSFVQYTVQEWLSGRLPDTHGKLTPASVKSGGG